MRRSVLDGTPSPAAITSALTVVPTGAVDLDGNEARIGAVAAGVSPTCETHHTDLADEAIWIGRSVVDALPDEPEPYDALYDAWYDALDDALYRGMRRQSAPSSTALLRAAKRTVPRTGWRRATLFRQAQCSSTSRNGRSAHICWRDRVAPRKPSLRTSARRD